VGEWYQKVFCKLPGDLHKLNVSSKSTYVVVILSLSANDMGSCLARGVTPHAANTEVALACQ
jgi:hypothetical protein